MFTINELHQRVQESLRRISGLANDSRKPERFSIAVSEGFRPIYTGDSPQIYMAKARYHAAAKHRDQRFDEAMELARADNTLALPPDKTGNPEQDLEMLRHWCIAAERSAKNAMASVALDKAPKEILGMTVCGFTIRILVAVLIIAACWAFKCGDVRSIRDNLIANLVWALGPTATFAYGMFAWLSRKKQ